MMRGKASSSKLRHKLSLQQEVLSADGVGGYSKTWQTLAMLWAELVPISGSEKLFAAQLQAATLFRVTIRYRAGVTVGMRLLFDNRAFNIRSITNRDERRDTLEMIAEEGVAT